MKVYLVGGAVRDALLKLPIQDKDWVVVGATPQDLIKKKYQKVGKDFPVFLHPETHEEYALARTERKYSVGCTSVKTCYSSKVTLEEDLIRRDLTINAIAQDNQGNYIDPFKGIIDLRLRILRHISHSFQDDPLRVLRVARFAAKFSNFGFKISEKTLRIMRIISTNQKLKYLTSERIWQETKKAFQTMYPHVYFQILHNCGALFSLFPEINKLFYQNIFPCNISSYFFFRQPLLFYLASIAKYNKRVTIRFALLCFLVVKKHFLLNNNINIFYDIHAKNLIKKICVRLKTSIYIRNICMNFSGFYDFLDSIFYQSSKNIILFFNKIDVWRRPKQFYDLLILIKFLKKNNLMKQYLLNYDISFFLLKSYFIMRSVSIQSIISTGCQGIDIKHALIKLRCLALDHWRIKYFF